MAKMDNMHIHGLMVKHIPDNVLGEFDYTSDNWEMQDKASKKRLIKSFARKGVRAIAHDERDSLDERCVQDMACAYAEKARDWFHRKYKELHMDENKKIALK